MPSDARNRIKRRRRAAKKANPDARTTAGDQSRALSRRSTTVGRLVHVDSYTVYSTCLYYAFLRALPRDDRGVYARVHTCGRGIRGAYVVYARYTRSRIYLSGETGGEGGRRRLYSRWSPLFRARKGSCDWNIIVFVVVR